MLNLYIGRPPKGMFKSVVYNPDEYFRGMNLYEIMNTDFAVRVAKACSGIATFENPLLMKTNSGRFVSALELSSGAKNLLIMKNTDEVVNLVWCGENCDRFVEEIADEKDLTIFTSRVYTPYKTSKRPVEFKVLNNNKVYTSALEYTRDIEIVLMLQDLVIPK